jgi:predicted ArsR family transcriptional regulator
VSDEGLRHLGENYRDLVLILWRSIHRIEDETVKKTVLRQIQDEFVQQYGRVATDGPIRDRMAQLQRELTSNGYDVEIGDGDLPIMRENSCPYQDLASADPSICEMEADVYSRILNAEVSLTQCCLDGHSCCEFQVQELTSTES